MAQGLFNRWSESILGLQMPNRGLSELDGGVMCPACAALHGRAAEAVWPFCWAWKRTGDSRYLVAAKRLMRWAVNNLERPDGSYLNDPNMSWRGTTVFLQTAIGRALELCGDDLDEKTREEWKEIFRRQTDWCWRWMEDPARVVNVNYRAGFALAMEFAARILRDEKYRAAGDVQAKRVLENIAADGLLFGEARPPEVVSGRGFRGVDVGYNVEETMPALLEWAELRGDSCALAKILDCAETHLWFLLSDGGVDNSFGSRAYKWTYWGSRTSDGMLPMLIILARHGRAGARSAIDRVLALYERCTTRSEGLLAGGLDYEAAGEPICVHHTFCHLKTLPQIIDANWNEITGGVLPADGAFGFRRFPTCGVTLVGIGDWRATFSENDVYFVDDNGKSTGGGSLTFLSHAQTGPVFAASMARWSLVERMNMQEQRKSDLNRSFTPRLETTDGRYMSVCDDRVDWMVSRTEDGVIAVAKGRLTDVADCVGPDFTMSWSISPAGVTVEATCQSAARLVLPLIASAAEKIELESTVPITIERSDRPDGLFFSSQTGFLVSYRTVLCSGSVRARIKARHAGL